MIAHFGPGVEIPLHPFFGSMGVAPPESAGRYDSAPPWMHAGNIDNKELIAGTTLFIPFMPGNLFEVGDGHAGQGNGEVDITAMETFLTGTFRFIVHKDQHLLWPRAETPTSYISMGFSPDLKDGDRCGPQHDRFSGGRKAFVARRRLHAYQRSRRCGHYPVSGRQYGRTCNLS